MENRRESQGNQLYWPSRVVLLILFHFLFHMLIQHNDKKSIVFFITSLVGTI